MEMLKTEIQVMGLIHSLVFEFCANGERGFMSHLILRTEYTTSACPSEPGSGLCFSSDLC
uniref:Uncharacterized protein n=1 Tax=Anguilla anguilla TaxID=7936 RepID=A0A0E9XJG2_ANGAN